MKIVPWPFTMTVSSLIAGTYAPPAVEEPMPSARSGIEEPLDPVTGEELAGFDMPFAGPLRSAQARLREALAKLGDETLHRLAIPGRSLVLPHARLQDGHGTMLERDQRRGRSFLKRFAGQQGGLAAAPEACRAALRRSRGAWDDGAGVVGAARWTAREGRPRAPRGSGDSTPRAAHRS